MAITALPTSTTFPYYIFGVELDGIEFRLQFKFNERDDSWELSILDSDDNYLRAGLKVVSDWPLMRLWQEIQKKPAGELIAVAQGGIDRPALLDELGEQVILTYLDAEEIAAAKAEA